MAVLRVQADKARKDGDLARAAEQYQQAAALAPVDDAGFETRFKLARLQYESGDVQGAIVGLQTLISDTRAISASHPALGTYHTLLGRAYEAAGDPPNAAAGYAAALTAGSPISPYLNLWLGNYYIALNQPISAVAPYQAAVLAAPSLAVEFERREKLALALQTSQQPEAALAQYDTILARAQFAAYRARMVWESAQVLLASGQTGPAYARLQDLVANYERTPQALQALQTLLNAGANVDELQRGKVNYYNQSYQAARDAFRRAIALNDGRADEIRLWAARNYMALGLTADAIRNLDQVLAGNALNTDNGALAAAIKIEALLADEATVAAKRLASQFATTAGAPAAELYRAGLALERAGLPEEAAQAYLSGVARADSTQPVLSQARAATLLMQLNRPVEAEPVLLQLLARAPEAADASRLRFWLSKAQIAAGNTITGQATLRALAEDFPDTYEGVRAGQIVSGAVFTSTGSTFLAPAADDGQPEAEAWLRAWQGISDTVDIRAPGEALLADPRYLRGAELWRLGFEPEALDEFGALMNANAEQPLALYQLALRFRDLGAYRLSIQAADALVRRSPARSAARAPVFIARLLYPAHYADLVQAAAAEFNINPLLVFSVMRQESLFEPFAESSAAASGLMQVIPSTGREINGDLNWPPGYSNVDLTKPYVSVRFGTYYLSKQRRLFDGLVYPMLAAYNGGPGNSLRWRERGGDDPDAFLEAVTFDETRRYIVAITVNLAQYARLYPPA